MATTLKTCSRCNVEKPIEQFGFLNRVQGKRALYCRACEAARMRAYYENHHDRILESQKALKREQRARKAAQQGEAS